MTEQSSPEPGDEKKTAEQTCAEENGAAAEDAEVDNSEKSLVEVPAAVDKKIPKTEYKTGYKSNNDESAGEESITPLATSGKVKKSKTFRKTTACPHCEPLGVNCGLVGGKCPNRPCTKCHGRHRLGRCPTLRSECLFPSQGVKKLGKEKLVAESLLVECQQMCNALRESLEKETDAKCIMHQKILELEQRLKEAQMSSRHMHDANQRSSDPTRLLQDVNDLNLDSVGSYSFDSPSMWEEGSRRPSFSSDFDDLDIVVDDAKCEERDELTEMSEPLWR